MYLSFKEKYETEEEELKKLIENLNKSLEENKKAEALRKDSDAFNANRRVHDAEVEKERLLALYDSMRNTTTTNLKNQTSKNKKKI